MEIFCLDCISVSILVLILYYAMQDVTFGGNWVKHVLNLSIVSYNCM